MVHCAAGVLDRELVVASAPIPASENIVGACPVTVDIVPVPIHCIAVSFISGSSHATAIAQVCSFAHELNTLVSTAGLQAPLVNGGSAGASYTMTI